MDKVSRKIEVRFSVPGRGLTVLDSDLHDSHDSGLQCLSDSDLQYLPDSGLQYLPDSDLQYLPDSGLIVMIILL
nr:hypothetical protein [Tanacetum cinerariifolium]